MEPQDKEPADGDQKKIEVRVSPKTPDWEVGTLGLPKSAPAVPKSEPAKEQQLATEQLVMVKSQPPSPPPSTPVPRTLRIRQPFKILTDIWGVMVPYSFRADLLTYLDSHLKEYLMSHLEEPSAELKNWLTLLSKQTLEEKVAHPKMPDLPPMLPGSGELCKAAGEQGKGAKSDLQPVAEAIVANVSYRKENHLMSGSLEIINNLLWNEAYAKKLLRPPLFDDVLPCFRQWAGPPLQIKIYTFASGPWEIQKLFLSASEAGTELTRHLTCGFQAFGNFKYQSQRYRQIVTSLTERDAHNLFYLTDSPNKAKQAKMAGLTVFVVRRPGNRNYRPELLAHLPLIDTLKQFDFYEFK